MFKRLLVNLSILHGVEFCVPAHAPSIMIRSELNSACDRLSGLDRIKSGMANSKSSKPKKREFTVNKPTRKKSVSMDGKNHRAANTAEKSNISRTKQPAKDPEGGLTAEGRKVFARKEGSHLRPGVKGPADTPEKMRRKGSFLRRQFTHPRGPMQRDGKPTRLALSAHAWGESVPKTMEDARKLTSKGRKMLERYRKVKAQAGRP